MQYNYWNLRQQPRGTVVEITLKGNAANVFLVDSKNYNLYKTGSRFHYYGGHTTRSPVQLTVPNSGHWYLVIDYGGLAGRGKASVRVLPQAM